jgi:hypothetical protein
MRRPNDEQKKIPDKIELGPMGRGAGGRMTSQISKPRWRLPSGVVFIGFLAIAAFFLFTEHRAHVLGILPFLLLLACPLMHLMHGHGGHGSRHEDSGTPDQRHDIQHQH